MKKQLTQQQIEQLIQQGCSAEDWGLIQVDNELNLLYIHHTAFKGHITIGKDVKLEHVGLIENYYIEDGVTIYRTNELSADKSWPDNFYQEGITVGNEAGDTNILFRPINNEFEDWIGLHYPQYRKGTHVLNNHFETLNKIGEGCVIRNSGVIRNVNMASHVVIEGAAHLEYGQLHEGCHIGTQVIAHSFSIGPRTRVTDGAKLYHVITTNDCKIGKGFMAENCYFSHHSELFCGEACAVFAGPHTVSHHKSTLLIGGEFSFYNAGSNTNQSNHAYKLGPIHYGTLARGSKTASGCHILWPMQTAPFSMVMGKVKTHPDLSALPFSYIIADSDKVYVVPGINLGTAGTFRDIIKWKQRGQSPYIGEYQFLSPWVMQSIFKGIDLLQQLQQTYGTEVEVYPYQGTFIRRSALEKGLSRYELAVRLYAGSISPTNNIFAEATGWHWIDIAGQPYVEEQLANILTSLIDTNGLDRNNLISKLNECYTSQAQQWGAAMLTERYGEDFTSGALQKTSQGAFEEWKSLLIADAHKELAFGDVSTDIVEDFTAKVKKTEIESL